MTGLRPLEWLKNTPEHWSIATLGRHASVQGGFAFPSEHFSQDGVPVIRMSNLKRGVIDTTDVVRIRDAYKYPAFALRQDDLLIGMSGSLSNYAMVNNADLPAVLNQRVGRFLIKNSHLTTQWLKYVIQSRAFISQMDTLATGTAQSNVSSRQIERILIAVPPRADLEVLVAFLDRATAEADALIVCFMQLLNLLRQQRASLITRAVTKGLDQKCPLKHSGTAWIGQIPEHWSMKRLWHFTPNDRQIMYGIVLPGPNVEEGVLIVKGGDVKPGRLNPQTLNRTTYEIESAYVRSRLRGGDLVYAIRGGIGDVEIVPDTLTGANLTQDAARISLRDGISNRWMKYVLESSPVFAQLEAAATGATIRGINIWSLKRAVIPTPPLQEQYAIASYIDEQLRRSDDLAAKVTAAIQLSKEHISALISAAVTGQLEESYYRELAVANVTK